MSINHRTFRKTARVIIPGSMALPPFFLLAGLLVGVMSMRWGVFQRAGQHPEVVNAADGSAQLRPMPVNSAPLSFSLDPTIYLPIVFRPVQDLKSLVTEITVTLPQPLSAASSNWCTWSWCTVSPRLYHEPLVDGRTLVGWTDSSGDGHVSVVGSAGSLEQTYDFQALSVRGLAAHIPMAGLRCSCMILAPIRCGSPSVKRTGVRSGRPISTAA